jgi:hypothetical protein
MSSFNEFYKFLIKNGCRVDRKGKGSCVMLIGPNGKNTAQRKLKKQPKRGF